MSDLIALPALPYRELSPLVDVINRLMKRLSERIDRIPGQDQLGSGLGLAIAERAAQGNTAVIRLANRDGGTGLQVTVDFAAA